MEKTLIKVGQVAFVRNPRTSVYKTLFIEQNSTPNNIAVIFKVGQMKRAEQDLTAYFDTFHKVLETGIQLTEEEYKKFSIQFWNKANKKAKECMEMAMDSQLESGYYFGYLPQTK